MADGAALDEVLDTAYAAYEAAVEVKRAARRAYGEDVSPQADAALELARNLAREALRTYSDLANLAVTD